MFAVIKYGSAETDWIPPPSRSDTCCVLPMDRRFLARNTERRPLAPVSLSDCSPPSQPYAFPCLFLPPDVAVCLKSSVRIRCAGRPRGYQQPLHTHKRKESGWGAAEPKNGVGWAAQSAASLQDALRDATHDFAFSCDGRQRRSSADPEMREGGINCTVSVSKVSKSSRRSLRAFRGEGSGRHARR
jgi:hypothetical protein